MQKVLVAGGTGLVGQMLLENLSRRSDCQITALVRKSIDLPKGVRQVLVKYENGSEGVLAQLGRETFDLVVCCVGTTRKDAGSAENFVKIEYGIPKILIEVARANANAPRFAYISSLGADRPVGLYLSTKNKIEQMIIESGLGYFIFRPSLILGERSQIRLGEQIGQVVMPAVFDWLNRTPFCKASWFKKYRPVAASDIAKTMEVYLFSAASKTNVVVEGEMFMRESSRK
jgi:uncharacterized protein YbjT (DUF2867 family)